MKRNGVPFILLLLAAALPHARGQEQTFAGERCDGPVYRQGEVTRKPVIRERPAPGLTEEARANGASGVVSLAAVLCRTGRVTDIEVLKDVPDGMTELVVAAVRQMRFVPAEKDGRPVSTHYTLEYRFNVAGGDECKGDGCAGRTVEDLIVEGNRRLTDEEILGHIKTRPGDAYDAEQVQRDLRALLRLSLLDTAGTRVITEEGRRGGVVVIFHVSERPVVRDVMFSGLEGVTAEEVLKAWELAGIRLCKECPYDPSQVAAARNVVRALAAARGMPNATVETSLEALSAVSVSLVFSVSPEGQ